MIATGFLRLGPHDNAAKLFDEQDRSRAELLADVTESTAAAFLGLTMSCCRCHDHKYDPISQADHYRIRAFFAAMKFADDVPLDFSEEQAAIKTHNETVEAEAKPLREKMASLPESDAAGREELKRQMEAIEGRRRAFRLGLLMTDGAEGVAETRVLFQGDHKSPRDVVQAGVLSVFDPQPATITKSTNSRTTGRRLTLANWIASPAKSADRAGVCQPYLAKPHGPPAGRNAERLWPGRCAGRKMLRYSIGWRTNLCGKDGRSSSSCDWLRRAQPIGKRRRSQPNTLPCVRRGG